MMEDEPGITVHALNPSALDAAGAAATATAAIATAAAATAHTAVPRVRVLSFNVNGLRACLKRLHCTIAQLLELLNADIVGFQETKLRRADLDSELACVDGWDSFFCCDTTSGTGYSGTATYCRTALTLPFAAEEGFTGCAAAATAAAGCNGASAAAAAAPHPSLAEHFSVEELVELDAEGRVVVTDHGAFVLFNLYGPAITSEEPERAEERSRYKMRFYKALELRWRDLLRRGRPVVAVGDFNICPAPIDHPEPGGAQHFRPSRPDRLWLRRLLHGDGSSGLPSAAGRGTVPQLPPPAGAADEACASGSSGGFEWQGTAAAGVAAVAAAAAAAEARELAAGAGGAEEAEDSRDICCASVGSAQAGGPLASLAPCGTAGAGSSEGDGSGDGAGMRSVVEPLQCRFADTFRHFYPTRPKAATCWSTVTNARVNNWGSRIDLILTAGLSVGQPPPPGASAPSAAGAPAATHPAAGTGQGAGGSGNGGASAGGAPPAVWVAASEIWPEQEGSDHCPVFADFECAPGAAFPCSTKAPPTAMRNVFVGRQHKLHRWLASAKPLAGACGSGAGASDACSDASLAPSQQQQLQQLEQQSGWAPSAPAGIAGASQDSSIQAASSGAQGPAPPAAAAGPGGAGRKEGGKKQASLKAFFQPPAALAAQQQQLQPQPQQQDVHLGQPQPQQAVQLGQQQAQQAIQLGQQEQQQGAAGPAPASFDPAAAAAETAAMEEAVAAAETARAAKHQQSKQAWAGLMAKGKPPLCRHGEPTALLKVNKTGPNKGRWFFTCARPAGEPPEGKCAFFKWVEKKPGDHQLTTLGAGGTQRPGTGGGGPSSKRLKS